MSNPHSKKPLAPVVIGAIGVVFGDIGTSPLYALKEIFNGHHPIPITPDNIFGILSMVFWSIVALVAVKYVSVIMRADNRGEGGSLALLSLIPALEVGPIEVTPLLLIDAFACYYMAVVLAASLAAGQTLQYSPQAGRKLYLVPALGTLEVNGVRAECGDGLAIAGEELLQISAHAASEIVLVDAA